jgi:iron complex transport system ATP-binding protein
MIELRDVTVRAGGATLLDDVSVAFPRDRFTAILGPNGAGKSTMIRVAAGLLHPTSGTVAYDGVPLDTIAPEALARQRALLSQHVELAFPLPAAEVVMMGRYPHFRGAAAPRDHEVVARALEQVGMTHRAAQPYPTLSGGERQKVQLARVLAQIWRGSDTAHRTLLLDEPTTGLDVHYQLQILQTARELAGEDCTVVAILHDLNVALRYADHLVVLEGGRVALETGASAALDAALIERVFRVRARAVPVDADGAPLWTFSL